MATVRHTDGPITDEFGWKEAEELVVLTVPGGASLTIATYGAHVTHWGHALAPRALWMSSLSAKGRQGAIRGGVPIAFPQFANQGPLSLHGFARTQIWTVLSTKSGDDSAEAVLGLEPNAETLALWPHKFALKYTVRLAPAQLILSLAVTNTDAVAWEFTSCLHTYLRVPQIAECSLTGLQGAEYTDKVDGGKLKTEAADALRVPAASAESSPHGDGTEGFVDRIYKGPSKRTVLAGGGLEYAIEQAAWPDTVVFNPWETGKKGDKGPDFDDDGYQHLLCVEPAIAAAPQSLQPGETWEGSQTLSVRALP